MVYPLMSSCSTATNLQLANYPLSIILAQHESRIENHQPSLIAQRPRRSTSVPQSTVKLGQIVYLKNDRSKHKAREQYIVISREGDWLIIRKLHNNLMRGREYRVHISECFTVVSKPIKPPIPNSDDEESDYLPTPSAAPNLPPIQPTDSHSASQQCSGNNDLVTLNPEIMENTIADPLSVNLPCNSDSTLQRRNPTRTRKRPSYLQDYVCSTDSANSEEKEEDEEGAAPGY